MRAYVGEGVCVGRVGDVCICVGKGVCVGGGEGMHVGGVSC